MKIGLIARSDSGGLGHITWETFRHINPYKTLVIDLSSMNGHKQHPERYTGNVKTHQGFLTEEAAQWITDDVDVVLTYEIPYGYDLYNIARNKGVLTVNQINYEFLDHLNNPRLPFPDVLASPSSWHYEDLQRQFGDKCKIQMLKTPVDRERLPFREIESIHTFVHIAGVKLHEDRNGTELLLQAIPWVKSDVQFIIYSQHDLPPITDKRVKVKPPVDNYWELYKEGDCLVLPRRYGGQTLQMNEAMSVGMIPLMLDCDPNNKVLDPMSLIPITGSKSIFTRTNIDCYTTTPNILAKKIDDMARLSAEEVITLNTISDIYADTISWKNRLHDYHHFTR